MRSQRLRLAALLFACVSGTAVPSITVAERAAPERLVDVGSAAVNPEIIAAITAEMDRALRALRIDGMPAPYHISYKITEVEVNDVAASLGQIISRQDRHFVNLEARVRVGSFDLDNGNFVVPDAEGIDGVAGISLPLEASPRIAARAAWLATDQAYKEAIMQLRAKLDSRKAGTGGQAGASWAPSKPLVNPSEVRVPPLETLPALEARAMEVSGALRGRPELRDSRVAFTSYLERRWYVNSEGTSTTDTRRASGVAVVASGQAQDGQELLQHAVRYGRTGADLPTDSELKAEAKRLGDTIIALAKAPVLETYTGPVLFEGDGAIAAVRYGLAPHLGGTPLPEGLRPELAKLFGGELNDKLGRRVLPTAISVSDDPTAKAIGTVPVIGGYQVDDEGVPAQRVELVKDGSLVSLLTTRTPATPGAASNGHARRTAPGGMFHGSATNLALTAKGGLARKQLVGKLLAAAKDEGLPYGVIIRQLDDAALTSAPEFSRRELLGLLRTFNSAWPPPVTVALRVWPNGKEELVRGLQLDAIPIGAWKDILAVGKTTTVRNLLAAGERYLEQKIDGVNEGYVPTAGIESAIATPDLLFRDLTLMPSKAGRIALPVVPPPAAVP